MTTYYKTAPSDSLLPPRLHQWGYK